MSCREIPIELIELLRLKYEEGGFCFETRSLLSDLIETKFNDDNNVNDADAQKSVASQLLKALDELIQENKKSTQRFSMSQTILTSTYKKLTERHTVHGSTDLYTIVVQCLKEENDVIIKHGNESFQEGIDHLTEEIVASEKDLEEVKKKHTEYTKTDGQLKNTETKYEEKRLHENEQRQENEQSLQKIKKKITDLERAKKNRMTNLNNEQQNLIKKLNNICGRYETVENEVLNRKLMMWKKDQRSGKCDQDELIQIEKWCVGLYNIISMMHKLVLKLKDYTHSQDVIEDVDKLLSKICKLLKNLVERAFIIEEQPPKILRTGVTKIETKVRLLIGKILTQKKVKVKAIIVYGEDVKDYISKKKYEDEENSLGKIGLKDSKTGEWKESNEKPLKYDINETCCWYKDTKIEPGSMNRYSSNSGMCKDHAQKKCEKCGTQFAGEKLYSIIFWTKFIVDNIEYQLCVPSIPVVILSQPSQKELGESALFWVSAGEDVTTVKTNLSWTQICEELSNKWMTEIGRKLTDENKYYLACKAFRNLSLDRKYFNQMTLSFSEFAKDKMDPESGQNFTFWNWFCSMLETAKDQLKEFAKEGYVIGFIGKDEVKSLLKTQPNGTFLLRFSDSELGAVSVWKITCQNGSEIPEVEAVVPYSNDALKARGGLTCFINSLPDISELYQPEKNVALTKAFPKQLKVVKGKPDYVGTEETTTVSYQKPRIEVETATSQDQDQQDIAGLRPRIRQMSLDEAQKKHVGSMCCQPQGYPSQHQQAPQMNNLLEKIMKDNGIPNEPVTSQNPHQPQTIHHNPSVTGSQEILPESPMPMEFDLEQFSPVSQSPQDLQYQPQQDPPSNPQYYHLQSQGIQNSQFPSQTAYIPQATQCQPLVMQNGQGNLQIQQDPPSNPHYCHWQSQGIQNDQYPSQTQQSPQGIQNGQFPSQTAQIPQATQCQPLVMQNGQGTSQIQQDPPSNPQYYQWQSQGIQNGQFPSQTAHIPQVYPCNQATQCQPLVMQNGQGNLQTQQDPQSNQHFPTQQNTQDTQWQSQGIQNGQFPSQTQQSPQTNKNVSQGLEAIQEIQSDQSASKTQELENIVQKL